VFLARPFQVPLFRRNPVVRADPGAERSVVDALVEGGFDDLPKCAKCDEFGPGVECLPDSIRDQLRRVANHRFFPTVEAQWAAAADVLREWRDG
jgi:hypothetical protein